MTICLFRSLVAAVMVLTAAGVAQANYPHSICRWSGMGWSDGYHSQSACPPKHHAIARQTAPVIQTVPVIQEAPKTIPWWMTPAADAEQAPTPADPQPGDNQSQGRQPRNNSSFSAPSIRR